MAQQRGLQRRSRRLATLGEWVAAIWTVAARVRARAARLVATTGVEGGDARATRGVARAVGWECALASMAMVRRSDGAMASVATGAQWAGGDVARWGGEREAAVGLVRQVETCALCQRRPWPTAAGCGRCADCTAMAWGEHAREAWTAVLGTRWRQRAGRAAAARARVE